MAEVFGTCEDSIHPVSFLGYLSSPEVTLYFLLNNLFRYIQIGRWGRYSKHHSDYTAEHQVPAGLEREESWTQAKQGGEQSEVKRRGGGCYGSGVPCGISPSLIGAGIHAIPKFMFCSQTASW